MSKFIISKICDVDGCDRKARSNIARWCGKHYHRWQRHGSPDVLIRDHKNTKGSFFSKIEIVTESGCWVWMGSLTESGYGRFFIGGELISAHRYSYGVHNGGIPDVPLGGADSRGNCVLHTCDIRCCVNPEHLYLGTHQDNMDDMNSRGRANRPIGADHFRAKFNESQVADIISKRNAGESCPSIAKDYGVSKSTISYICRGGYGQEPCDSRIDCRTKKYRSGALR